MDRAFRGKNLQEKLDTLLETGMDRESALEVMKYHIREQYQDTGKDTLSAAYQAGPGFDLGFYQKMSGEGSWLTHWHEFHLSELRDAFLELPEEAASGYAGMQVMGYAAAFLTLLAAISGCGGGQDSGQAQDGPIIVPDSPGIAVPEPILTPGKFRFHEFMYGHGDSSYRVTLMTDGPKAGDMESALRQVRRDDVMAMVTVGCDRKTSDRLHSMAVRLYRAGPRLMRELEPVVIRLGEGSTTSSAGPNCTDDITEMLPRIGERRTDKGDYGDYCDWFVQDADMPESEADFLGMMEAIKERYLTVYKGDMLDVVSCGIGTEDSIVHEFGHLVTMEDPEVYYQMLQWLKGTVPLPRIGRHLTFQDYAGMRWREVEAWADGKMKDAERKMAEELDKPGTHPRFRAAISSFGSPEAALRKYRELIDEGTLYYKYTEDLAEGTVDFIFQTLTHMQDIKMYTAEASSDSGIGFFERFHRELEDKLEEARKAGDQGRAAGLEKMIMEDAEFLDRVREDHYSRLLRFRRSMASLAVEDLFNGDIGPEGESR